MLVNQSKYSSGQAPIVVKLTGGLGNQLFGVAAGLGISRSHGLPLVLHVSKFSQDGEVRSSGLDCYNLAFDVVNDVTINEANAEFDLNGERIVAPVAEERSHRFDSSLISRCKDGAYLTGYFQSHRYFDDIAEDVRSIFRNFSKHDDQGSALKAEISGSNAVGIHVRRGDYLKSPYHAFHGLCRIEFYRRAIQKMRAKLSSPRFFVFSDDLDWCRANITGDDIVVSKGGLSANADLDLLATCQHHILSNSSFSWWGAWLGYSKTQVVIAPCPWYTRIPLVPDMMLPAWELSHRETGEDWASLENEIERTRVSVVVPTHRRVGPLREAVQSALEQTHPNLDVTIVLSSASDAVKEEAAQRQREDGRVNVVSAATPGPSAARNAGARTSKGEWIAFLDDDDVWFPDKIRTQLTAAIALGAEAVSCEHSTSGPGLMKFAYPRAGLSLREALVLENFFSGGSAAIVSRNAFCKAGGFDEALQGCEDHDLWRRLSLNHELLIIAEPLLEIRRLDESHSFDSLMMLQSQVQHLVKIVRETPSDLGNVVEIAFRNAHARLAAVAAEHGYQIARDSDAVRRLVRRAARGLVRRVDSVLPGTLHGCRKALALVRRIGSRAT